MNMSSGGLLLWTLQNLLVDLSHESIYHLPHAGRWFSPGGSAVSWIDKGAYDPVGETVTQKPISVSQILRDILTPGTFKANDPGFHHNAFTYFLKKSV